MMVCWSFAASVRVENFANCTSGMRVVIANIPRAVEKCGVKHRLKKIPLSQSDLIYGVVFNGLPLMLVLYMLNDSQTTKTTFGLEVKYFDAGSTTFLYVCALGSQFIHWLNA